MTPFRIYLGIAFAILTTAMCFAAESHLAPMPSEKLQKIVLAAAQQAANQFAAQKLLVEEIAITMADVTEPHAITTGSFRGAEKIYPASVVKLFYLEAAHRWMEDGKIADTAELRRTMRDMIVESYNEATHYVLDVVTGTTSGPELAPDQMAEWGRKRNAVNRYFEGRGFKNINANQKPWCEGPYGRDRAWVGQSYANRNMLTTDATARLLGEIATLQAVTPARSLQMLELLRRDPFGPATDPDDQAHGFSGPAIPPGSKLWSKAGWTSQTRHDAAHIELPNGRKVVLVIFTVNHANEREIIPAIARMLLKPAIE
jgi:hypothetical protein